MKIRATKEAWGLIQYRMAQIEAEGHIPEQPYLWETEDGLLYADHLQNQLETIRKEKRNG